MNELKECIQTLVLCILSYVFFKPSTNTVTKEKIIYRDTVVHTHEYDVSIMSYKHSPTIWKDSIIRKHIDLHELQHYMANSLK